MLAALQSGMRPREERVTVLIPSRMRVETQWVDACIHNLSSRGLMAGCDQPPRVGSYIEIRRGTLVIVGKVMWSKGRFFGIRSQDRLSVPALVKEPRLASRPRADNDPGDTLDRRQETRLEIEARLARKLERSRAFAAAFQFVVMGVVILTVAGLGASFVYEALSSPLAQVERSMAAQQ